MSNLPEFNKYILVAIVALAILTLLAPDRIFDRFKKIAAIFVYVAIAAGVLWIPVNELIKSKQPPEQSEEQETTPS